MLCEFCKKFFDGEIVERNVESYHQSALAACPHCGQPYIVRAVVRFEWNRTNTERDIEDATSYDIILYSDHANKTPTCEEQNAIHQLLQHNDVVNISLIKSTTKVGRLYGESTILITNEKNEVLREIDVDGIHSVEDNLMIILQSNL